MNRIRVLPITCSLGLMAILLPRVSQGDEWNKKTSLTVNEPVEIPGKVLQPGTYVLRLADSQSNRHIVQVLNQDETKVESTILAIPNYRLEPTGDSQFGYWEMPAGQPRALKAWFYPGDNFGQEFAYPTEMATTIAQTNNQPVPAVTGDANNGQIATVNPSENSTMAEARPPAEPQQNQGSSTMSQSNQQQPTDQNSTSSTSSSSSATDQGSSASSSATPSNQGTPSNATSSNTTSNQATSPSMNQQNGQNSSSTTSSTTQSNNTNTNSTANQNGTLPRTASPFPLFGLGGALSFAAAAAVRFARRRRA